MIKANDVLGGERSSWLGLVSNGILFRLQVHLILVQPYVKRCTGTLIVHT